MSSDDAVPKVPANQASRFTVTIVAKGFASKGSVYPVALQGYQAELFRTAQGAPGYYFARKIGLASRTGLDSSEQ